MHAHCCSSERCASRPALIDGWAFLNFGTFIGCVKLADLLREPLPLLLGVLSRFRRRFWIRTTKGNPQNSSSPTMSGGPRPPPSSPWPPQLDPYLLPQRPAHPPHFGPREKYTLPSTYTSRLELSLEVAVWSGIYVFNFLVPSVFSSILSQCRFTPVLRSEWGPIATSFCD